MRILKIGGDYTSANNFAVTTFLNINGNNTSDEEEPAGKYANSPPTFTQNASNADIILTESPVKWSCSSRARQWQPNFALTIVSLF